MKVEGCTQEELAKCLSLDRSTIANLVRLLDLPQDLQTAIREDKISAAHGRALLPLKDAELQREFMERIVSDHLSAHQVEDMVRDFLNSENGHRLGSFRPRNVTFWVEYSLDEHGFVLHAAWCHRMIVPGSGGRPANEVIDEQQALQKDAANVGGAQ